MNKTLILPTGQHGQYKPELYHTEYEKRFINSILTLILSVTTTQTDVVKGRVLDADTGETLSGAEVVLPFNVLFFIFAANYK